MIGAHKHVAGEAVYIDDMPEPAGHAARLPRPANGRARPDPRSTSTRCAPPPGVVDVLTAADMPGENDISPTGRHDEPVLAADKVEFIGQPIFAGRRRDPRCRTARLPRSPRSSYEELPAVIDVGGARCRQGAGW